MNGSNNFVRIMIRKLMVVCLISACACSEDKPKDILSDDELTNILIDIYITESKVANYTPRIPRDTALVVFDTLRADILQKYDLTDSAFRHSMRYYFQNPEVLNSVYARVIDSLNLKVQKFEEKKERNNKQ